MKIFTEIKNDFKVTTLEERILKFWKDNKIFEESCKQTKNGPPFIFYEGPPTANGKPGLHHILSRVFKDVYLRFYTQLGYNVPRKAGWDCHGLPVEREVEKKLDIKSKTEIEEKYGIARFNELCKESVLGYVKDWNTFSERMAFFIDMKNPYYTMDNEYIEVLWGLLKQIWDKNLIYQGYKVVPYDPILGATMSDAEVDQGYKEIEDPSLYVKFKLKEKNIFGNETSLLVWTTTPWTLAANVAIAINPQEDYLLVKSLTSSTENIFCKENEQLIFAKALLENIITENFRNNFEIIKTFKGESLLNLEYERIFNFEEKTVTHNNKNAWKILSGSFVSMDTGSGLVHIAPAYGADDLELGQKENLPIIHCVGLDGKYLKGSGFIDGVFFKDADKLIIKKLKELELVFKIEKYKHKYPFGYRTGSPLLYYAKNAWYIRTTKIKNELIANNEKINWFPDHIKNGRFGNWLENNRDWALSRERFWGTPLPIWTDGKGNFKCISSRKELSILTKKDYSNLELHRPYVDEIEFTDPATNNLMKRVPEVIDCWFDSGAMPYAQMYEQGSYKEKQNDPNLLEKYFPADFITEAIDQTRGWFYTLLSISTMISGKSSYKNAICLGHVLDEKGEKMSKSKGNVINPESVFEKHGADAIRWYFLTASPPGASRRMASLGSANDPLTNVHSLINMLYNSINFFILYANIDGIKIERDWRNAPLEKAPPFEKRSDMDRWLLSLLQELIYKVTINLKEYNCQQAGKYLENFLDALSNWYIRRNRRRFWKAKLDKDKYSAYDTLYRSLTTVTSLLAPFIPFAAEVAFHSLVATPNSRLKYKQKSQNNQSVHLAGWPKVDQKNFYDYDILQEGEVVREIVFLGRSSRKQSGVKIRQPLGNLLIYLQDKNLKKIVLKNKSVILEELNVKKLEFIDNSSEILDYRIRPNLPRLGKRLGNKIPILQDYFKKINAREFINQLRVSKDKKVEVILQKENLKASTNENNITENSITIEEEDLIIENISKEGTSGVESNGKIVALDIILTKELLAEGKARDVVRNIQELRKINNFEVQDRIFINFEFSNIEQEKELSDFFKYIENETLGEIVKKFPESENIFYEKNIIFENQNINLIENLKSENNKIIKNELVIKILLKKNNTKENTKETNITENKKENKKVIKKKIKK